MSVRRSRDDELLDVVFTPANNTSERRRYAYTVLTRLVRQDQHEQRWLRKALERHLPHTGDDAMAVAMETGSPMPAMIAEVLQTPKMPARQKLVNTLRVQVPKETINLLELAVTITQQHVALLVEKGPRRNFNTRLNAQDAYALLASRYEATGRFTEALDARQKAVEFAQALVKSNPSASNRHVLAQAAMSLSEIYRKTCHFREALENAQYAESLLHTLMQAQPRVYRPD
jgi:tetratricopeptide (TPR) repeat protein